MAVDAEVVPGPMPGWPPFPFALTPKARQKGAGALKVDTVHSGKYQSRHQHEQCTNPSRPYQIIRSVAFVNPFQTHLVHLRTREVVTNADNGQGNDDEQKTALLAEHYDIIAESPSPFVLSFIHSRIVS
ncbi:MAG: hypothetical protein WCA20_08465 [Candidatus Sulfotelmatobacter sp.]